MMSDASTIQMTANISTNMKSPDDRAQPCGVLRHDRGTDETPNDPLDAGHQQDDDPGEAQPNR
jgi:hypothetical protein